MQRSTDQELTFYQVGVLSSNPNEPIYYYNPNDEDNDMILIVFHTYDSSPPSSSVFEVPASCSRNSLRMTSPGKKSKR